MRVLLVGGSAPCLFADLEAARKLYPDAELMLINGAGVAVEDAEHLLAGHTDKAEQFAAARFAKWPFAMPWRLHATEWIRNRTDKRRYPSVTDWWPPDCASGASSAGKAALIGLRHLGADRVVLCGCPMDGSGYFPGESVDGAPIEQMKACQRIGDPKVQDRTLIRRYRETMAKLAQGEFKDRVFSMSGYSRQVLGGP